MHEVWDSPKGEAYPLKLPLNLSTGKVSHWKAKEIFDYKTNYKNHWEIFRLPRENKACKLVNITNLIG